MHFSILFPIALLASLALGLPANYCPKRKIALETSKPDVAGRFCNDIKLCGKCMTLKSDAQFTCHRIDDEKDKESIGETIYGDSFAIFKDRKCSFYTSIDCKAGGFIWSAQAPEIVGPVLKEQGTATPTSDKPDAPLTWKGGPRSYKCGPA